jgi:hypothetical protein
MFCAPGLIFDGTEDVGSRFHVLRSLTNFRRFRGHRVPFSCFARPDSFSVVPRRLVPFSCFTLPDMFSAVPSASSPVFMFCVRRLISGGPEGDRSSFHVLRAQIRFRRYRGRRVLFSRFARSDSFSAVPKASGLVFIFFAPGHVLGGAEGVRSRFHVLRNWTCFRRY